MESRRCVECGRKLTSQEAVRLAADIDFIEHHGHLIRVLPVGVPDNWVPEFSPWRHGGWYVNNVCYMSGAVGCVSRNYADRKWRIVGREDEGTYPNRLAAARAEYIIAEAERARVLSDPVVGDSAVCTHCRFGIVVSFVTDSGDAVWVHTHNDHTVCNWIDGMDPSSIVATPAP